MDRGRCGYDLVGNKFLREKTLTHVREVHLERLEKIKHREPGSSSTLDNTTPSSLSNGRIAQDPRKRRKKTERNNAIARQNKVLLQRISNILTAPPKVTDEDYQKMKRLMSSLDSVDSFTKDLVKKRNQQFFDRVKKTTAYYDHEQWEQEYQRQLHGQKFMRQVKYTRPADWVDPFQETSTATSDSISVAADRKSRSGPRRHPRDDLGSINEDSTVDHPEPTSTRSLDSSPLTTYRSNGSTASHASTSPSRRASSRGKMRSTKIRELRTTHLEQLNKSHGGGDGNHPRYAKRSASSQSLKSNGDSVQSDSQHSEHRSLHTSRGLLSKPPSRLLATCQRSISVLQSQAPELLLSSTGPRARTTSEISCDSDSSFHSTSHSTTLPPIRSTYSSSSFYRKEPDQLQQQLHPPVPKKIPSEIDVTIMCSIVSSVHPSFQSSSSALYPSAPATPTASSAHASAFNTATPSISFTSGNTELHFPLTMSHLFVTVDGVYDTSLHCEAQIPLSELLNLMESSSNPPLADGASGTAPGMGEDGGDVNCKADDDSTADLTILSSSLASASASASSAPSPVISSPSPSTQQITPLEIEEMSREIVHQISLSYDDLLEEFSIVLPHEDTLSLSTRTEDQQLSDELIAMTGDHALQIIKEFQSLSFSRGMSVPLESSTQLKTPLSPTNPVIITRQRSTADSSSAKAQQQQRMVTFHPENIFLLCKIKRISEDKAVIKCHILRDSTNKFVQKGRRLPAVPAVAMDSSLELTITLPSVLNVDPDLIQEYFQNISSHLKIQHNGTTGANTIVLQ